MLKFCISEVPDTWMGLATWAENPVPINAVRIKNMFLFIVYILSQNKKQKNHSTSYFVVNFVSN